MHVHVPKAGGSTLRQLMNRNFGEGFYNSNSLLETRQYTRGEVGEIIQGHSWLRCMSDHKLSLDLPFEMEEVNLLALSYVREPVERFISRYFFHRHFEEVNCIAQQMSFRDFANAELVKQECPPSTNSQIYFLNHGKSNTELDVVHAALNTGKAFLFPIERFDESCICLERMFQQSFADLSYVRANVSKRDAKVTEEERAFAHRYLKQDYPVWEMSQRFLDQTLARVFDSPEQQQAALEEFQDRCSRRHHNFHPPRSKEPVATEADSSPQPVATEPSEPASDAEATE